MNKQDQNKQPDNVTKIKDNGEIDKRKEEEKEALNLPHLTEEELMQFRLFDAEMTKRLLLLGNTNLSMRLEEAQHAQKMGTLVALRDRQQEDANAYQKKYEEFNKKLTEKYRLKPDKKISIDTETGVIKELP